MRINSEPLSDMPKKKNHFELIMFLIIGILIILDFFTTYIGINYYGLAEQNIFLNEVWSMRNYGKIIQFEIFGLFSYYGIYIFFGEIIPKMLFKKHVWMFKFFIIGILTASCFYPLLNNLLKII